MQHEFKFLNQLPLNIGNEVTPYLSTPDLLKISLLSKGHQFFSQSPLEVRKFLHYIVCGKYGKVLAMLEKDKTLLLKKGSVTDCSGRAFANITGFEYALWALDKPMWTTILTCIPPSEENKKILVNLLSQYNNITTKGLTYKLNGQIIRQQHFDFTNTIIKELQTYVNASGAPYVPGIKRDWDAVDKQWREGVGGTQKMLPMHVVYVYCSECPMSEFIIQPHSSTQFQNWDDPADTDWFGLNSKLGSDFAILKGNGSSTPNKNWCAYAVQNPRQTRGMYQQNLDSLKELFQARRDDFINLKLLLEQQIAYTNQCNLFQL
ncbi:F-box protein [Legionella gresilensis]|uniref:F-box protein n=1 Tax=Legionella gresilensis TaxID=91823 RepID=UPI0010416FF4|nr:F-box protein [Legionella gresilensis]